MHTQMTEQPQYEGEPRKQQGRCRWICPLVLMVLGVGVIVALCVVIPRVADNKVQEKLAERYVPSPGSDAFNDYLRNDDPSDPKEFTTFWLFNLTNPQDVLVKNAPPNFVRVGPFIYLTREYKMVVNADGTCAVGADASVPGKLTYKPVIQYTWYSDEVTFTNDDGTTTKMTSLDPSTTLITNIDVALVGAMEEVRVNPFYYKLPLPVNPCQLNPKWDSLQCFDVIMLLAGHVTNTTWDSLLAAGGFTPTKPASQWLAVTADGAVNSRVIQFAYSLANAGAGGGFTDSKFGIFYNHTEYGANPPHTECNKLRDLTVRFDADNLAEAQSIAVMQGNAVFPSRNQTLATKVNALIDFEMQFVGWGEPLDFGQQRVLNKMHTHPNLQKTDALNFWVDMGLRGIKTTFDREVTFKGVKAYRFTPDRSVLELSEENKRIYGSRFPGMSNEAPAKFLAPVHASNPNFYQWEKEVHSNFNFSLDPADEKRDAPFVFIEPTSGLVIGAALRLQVNVVTPSYLWSSVHSPIVKNYTMAANTLFPVMVFEVRSELTDDEASELKQLQNLDDIKLYMRLGGGIGGGLLVLVGVAMLYRATKRRQEGEDTYSDEESTGSYLLPHSANE